MHTCYRPEDMCRYFAEVLVTDEDREKRRLEEGVSAALLGQLLASD